MQHFTGKQYIKIAIANAFGLDKELFEDRIKWVEAKTMEELHALVEDADEPAIYLGALLAVSLQVLSVLVVEQISILTLLM